MHPHLKLEGVRKIYFRHNTLPASFSDIIYSRPRKRGEGGYGEKGVKGENKGIGREKGGWVRKAGG